MSDLFSTVADSVLSPFSSQATSWLNNTARESLNKNITKSNLKVQKSYDLWTQEQDKAYEKWFQEYLYGLQNNEYFNLAKKYATNTASWAVQGLKKAGLNPVLAAIDGNLSSSMGDANPQASGHRTGGGSVPHGGAPSALAGHTNIASSLQASSAAKLSSEQAKNAKLDNEVRSASAPAEVAKATFEADIAAQNRKQVETSTAVNAAEAERVQAEAQRIKADTLNSLLKTYSDLRSHGQGNSFLGQLNTFIHDITPDSDAMSAVSRSIMQSLGIGNDKQHSGKGLVIDVEGTTPWHDRASEYFDNLDKRKKD